MKNPYKALIGFALLMLALSIVFGVIAVLSFFAPNSIADIIPFQQARPFHVSAALFWIITAAVAGIILYKKELSPLRNDRWISAFAICWVLTVTAVFIAYAFNWYGGREYWEFPPVLNLFIWIAWIFLLISCFKIFCRLTGKIPVYIWMWSTGLLFFFFTFTEQNLWHISWFRESFLKEVTVQWKSNGSMVGAWNQMIYGTSVYLMVKISGDKSIGTSWKAYASFFLGLTNLIFNWGHHIYNVPSASWIRGIAYTISMTEWVLVISIIQGFKKKLEEQRKFRHLVTYRFLVAAEAWIFLNLVLALLMSVPAINRYTHGTHVTVAHAMGTTIGINTMILLGSISYMIRYGQGREQHNKYGLLNIAYWTSQAGLLIFWISLIIAGLIKGMRTAATPGALFSEIMAPVYPVLKVFMFSGFVLAGALFIIVILMLKALSRFRWTDAGDVPGAGSVQG